MLAEFCSKILQEMRQNTVHYYLQLTNAFTHLLDLLKELLTKHKNVLFELKS